MLEKPKPLAIFLIITSLGILLAAGVLSAHRHVVVDWQHFDQLSGLAALAAWAQLILAFAVWFQIRSAEAQRLDASRHHADFMRRADDDAVNDGIRAQVEAIVSFVGVCANASSLYQSAGRRLGVMITARQTNPVDAARVESDLALAEPLRQTAATAMFRVEALLGEDAVGFAAVTAFWGVMNRQQRAVREAQQWLNEGHHETTAMAPDVQRATRDSRPQRDDCIAQARALLLQIQSTQA
jgi:hypothetical protein